MCTYSFCLLTAIRFQPRLVFPSLSVLLLSKLFSFSTQKHLGCSDNFLFLYHICCRNSTSFISPFILEDTLSFWSVFLLYFSPCRPNNLCVSMCAQKQSFYQKKKKKEFCGCEILYSSAFLNLQLFLFLFRIFSSQN